MPDEHGKVWKLKTAKLGKLWWVTGDEDDGPFGPYFTRALAEESRRNIIQFYRHENEREFFTADPLPEETKK